MFCCIFRFCRTMKIFPFEFISTGMACRSCFCVLLFITGGQNWIQLHKSDHLQHSENSSSGNDCLFYRIRDDMIDYTEDRPMTHPYQILSYCLRSTVIGDDLKNQSSLSSKRFTFKELIMNHVTSLQLLSWSAPIDLVERYAHYLLYSHTDEYSSLIYYNCTPPLFGEFCQYTFGSHHSFDAIVRGVFLSKISHKDRYPPVIPDSQTCFTHLNCSRGPSPMCLDWREICDGHIDCADGIDEQNCFELHLNPCAQNEYRCHIGFCVPNEFVGDNWLNPDCLDGTDEDHSTDSEHYTSKCYLDPAFRCEERGKPQGYGFACGDGQFSALSIVAMNDGFLCKNGRDEIVNRAISTHDFNKHLTYLCWLSSTCNHPFQRYDDGLCEQWDASVADCNFLQCNRGCSQDFIFPNYPAFLGHIRYGFTGDPALIGFRPTSICYDDRLCRSFEPDDRIQGWPCVSIEGDRDWVSIGRTISSMIRNCSSVTFNNNRTFCNMESTVRCIDSSKCIFKHQLVDGIRDCPLGDDEETTESCSLNNRHRFRCTSENKCLSRWLLSNGVNDCAGGEDENDNVELVLGTLFSNICNKVVDIHLPILVAGQNETDETNCEQWPCKNQYTRCNGFWDCADGTDETGCVNGLCGEGHHPCVSAMTYEFICLPQSKIGDNITDCLGSYDERAYCRALQPKRPDRRFRCVNSPSCAPLLPLCKSQRDGCSSDNKTVLCKNLFVVDNKCTGNWSFVCDNEDRWAISDNIYFELEDDQSIITGGLKRASVELSSESHPTRRGEKVVSDNFIKNVSYTEAWLCNRGIMVRTSLKREELCLCPPSYYGRRCENQNERVSVTLKLRKENHPLSRRQIFHMVIMLIDNSDQIHSHDYFLFTSADQCIFNLYLLYLNRPKDTNKTYTVRIDAYLINHFTLHARWLLPVPFWFLPVNRVTSSLVVPLEEASITGNCQTHCVHGQCIKFINSNKQSCRCEANWFGARCETRLNCDCSPDSLCIGITENRSICICSIQKFGPRCLLTRTACDRSMCLHGGICVPDDERASSTLFRCICTAGYSGLRCEVADTQIHIQFSGIAIPSTLLLHYVSVSNDAKPVTTTLFRKIFAYENGFTVNTSLIFHILLVEFDDSYYLSVVQKHHKSSSIISDKITRNHRCRSIMELFNETFVSWPSLRRVKYYHLPCQKKNNLLCHYDGHLMCICNSYGHANCFEFKSTVLHECGGNDYCLNGGRCFQDKPDCPSSLMCACSECFYGTRCQLTTKGFSMSLDSILGYSIRPQTNFGQQSVVVKVSAVSIIFIFIIGFINGVISMVAFGGKTIRSIGCGWYLLALSITSLLTMILLMVKFWLLLLSHMSIITRQSIILGHCISIDFLIRAILSTNYWLSTFVAVERMFMAIRGVAFDKRKSVRIAKWIIVTLPFFLVGSSVQEIFYRSLIDDPEERRIWCVIIYPHRTIELINWSLYICQSVVPFSINFVVTIVIIYVIARRHTVSRIDRTYTQHLHKQFIEQKHLLLTPCILIFLNIPRLILFFTATCMKTMREPWLFLSGYLLTFVPPMLTAVIFVLPSKTYTLELRHRIGRIFFIQHSPRAHITSKKSSGLQHDN